MEATIEQLQNGLLWMLIRTNWGKFWQAFSKDDGLTWGSFGISNIDASSSPGLLKRLESGRLILVWNRLYPEGQNDYPLIGGNYQLTEVPANFHRSELSMALSNDDGKTWTKPVVIAKTIREKTQLAYPFLFEAKPGEIWVTTMADQIALKIMEKDYFKDNHTTYAEE
jgi:Neuraminidase (sialidase)